MLSLPLKRVAPFWLPFGGAFSLPYSPLFIFALFLRSIFSMAIYYRERITGVKPYVGYRASSHKGRALVGSSWVVVAGGLTA